MEELRKHRWTINNNNKNIMKITIPERLFFSKTFEGITGKVYEGIPSEVPRIYLEFTEVFLRYFMEELRRNTLKGFLEKS